MDAEQRSEAIFGAFDGVVSIIGFVFGLLVHDASAATIAIGGIGGAVAAGVSMGAGEIEKSGSPWRSRIRIAITMFIASFVGGLIPVWPFLIFSNPVALLFAAIGCILVALWIGYEKRQGWRGYVNAFGVLLVAAGLTLLVVSLIPASV